MCDRVEVSFKKALGRSFMKLLRGDNSHTRNMRHLGVLKAWSVASPTEMLQVCHSLAYGWYNRMINLLKAPFSSHDTPLPACVSALCVRPSGANNAVPQSTPSSPNLGSEYCLTDP